MDAPKTLDDMTEVYATADLAVAERVLDEVLIPAGIPAAIHNRQSSALPAPSSLFGRYFIAVPKNRAAEAIDALREAQEAGVLGDEGELAEA
jgi:hypothetical protein